MMSYLLVRSERAAATLYFFVAAFFGGIGGCALVTLLGFTNIALLVIGGVVVTFVVESYFADQEWPTLARFLMETQGRTMLFAAFIGAMVAPTWVVWLLNLAIPVKEAFRVDAQQLGWSLLIATFGFGMVIASLWRFPYKN